MDLEKLNLQELTIEEAKATNGGGLITMAAGSIAFVLGGGFALITGILAVPALIGAGVAAVGATAVAAGAGAIGTFGIGLIGSILGYNK
jgi:hypothetical protein